MNKDIIMFYKALLFKNNKKKHPSYQAHKEIGLTG